MCFRNRVEFLIQHFSIRYDHATPSGHFEVCGGTVDGSGGVIWEWADAEETELKVQTYKGLPDGSLIARSWQELDRAMVGVVRCGTWLTELIGMSNNWLLEDQNEYVFVANLLQKHPWLGGELQAQENRPWEEFTAIVAQSSVKQAPIPSFEFN